METKTNEKKNTTLSAAEISSFCNQMYLVLHSGISAQEGISIILDDSESKAETEILQAIYDELLMTGNLHNSLEKAGVFPSYMLKMVQLGELSGRLDETLSSLAVYYERENSISGAIRNAISYPLVMVAMMLIIVLILILKVLPVFNRVFAQLGQEMNGFSKGLLHAGTTISRYSMVFVVLIAILVLALFYLAKTQKGNKILSSSVGKMKFSRELSDKVSACRFAGALATALGSGLTPEESIELAGQLTEDETFIKKSTEAKEALYEGRELADILHEQKLFSGVYSRLITIGAKTGSLDSVLKKIADQYEEEIDRKLSSIISVLEPTLVAILSVIVGLILLSVMMPLLGILSGI